MKETPYKQKVRAQIKTALDRFHKTEARHLKTQNSKLIKKKIFKQAKNYLQRQISLKTSQQCHVLNFYNILAINEKSIRDINHHESFIKTHFYFKNLRKLQISQNYIAALLGDNHSLICPVSQIIARYKTDSDIRFNKIAALLQGIQKRLKMNKPQVSSSSSDIQESSIKLLQELGQSAYICKIASHKLVISKSLMQIFGYNSQEFMIECLKFRMPLFEGFSCQNYYQVMMKNLQNVNLLMDLLQGTIPYSTFQQLSAYNYTQKIRSKNNIQYTCIMSITMPIPLISLVKVEKIIKSSQILKVDGNQTSERGFKKFCDQIRRKQYRILQNLVKLPQNILSKNIKKVASYKEKDTASQEDIKSMNFTESK